MYLQTTDSLFQDNPLMSGNYFHNSLFRGNPFQETIFQWNCSTKPLFRGLTVQIRIVSKTMALFQWDCVSARTLFREPFSRKLVHNNSFLRNCFSKNFFQRNFFKGIVLQESLSRKLLFEVTISICLFYFIKAPIWPTPAI